MNDDELASVLEDAGLSPYQAEAYVTLLSLGTASATDVAEACEVPDPRIYDVLRDLEGKGYVETFQQDSLTARARDPSEVQRDLESRSSQFIDAAEAIDERYSQPAVGDHEVTVLKRYETVLEQAAELIQNADTQVSVAVPVEDLPAIRDALAGAHERGVYVRVTVATTGPDGTVPDPSELEGVCAEARHRPTPSSLLVIVDRTWTAFMPAHTTSSEYGLIVNDPAHTSMFQWVFATVLWGGSETIYRERSGDTPRSYVDIRRCLTDLQDPIEAGATVEVTVDGTVVETGADVTLEGTIERLNLGWNEDGGDVDPMAHPAGPLSFTLQTYDGRTFEVGGWGAVLEDVEATRVTVECISHE